MRGILVDWIVEAHLKFRLREETLFLAMSILDRFLARKQVLKYNLQLVGATSLFIACKFEEILPPDNKSFIRMSSYTYQVGDLVRAEAEILEELDYRVLTPIPLLFLQRYAIALNAEAKIRCLALYLVQLSMLCSKQSCIRGSLRATAALYLAHKILKKSLDLHKLSVKSKYGEQSIRRVARELVILFITAGRSGLTAVRSKFSMPAFSEVAKIKLDAN